MYEYGQYNQLIATNKDKLMNLATAKYHSQELTVIHKALNYAEKAHFKQKRKSGEPYLIHPIATAIKLIEWGMDFESVAAGLLHDVIEDTEYHYQDLLITFGQNIAVIVKTISKVTKYSKSKHNKINLEELKKSYVLQVFLSMSEDLRAIVVKLADRIHNIETIHNLNPNKQFAIAKETLTIYAVIAGRIGMYNIKQQLEDMCFKIIDPNSYWTIYKYIKKLEANIEDTWKRIQTQIKNMLEIEGIENQINYRLKGIYSIWKKMEKGYLPENIHDVFAMRIIVKNELQCYHVLGLIHLNFIYIMNAFKDFVSLPKWNLYRSIHTTIIANKFLVEFQIRTQEMHQISQMGLAAHWQYKEGNKYSQVSKKMVEQFLQGRKESTDTIKDLVKNELFNVYVLNDSRSYVATNTTTLLDLAYRFNLTKLTHLNSVFCNGEQVSFDTRLNRGDVVQFNYSHKVKIEDSWLTATKNINTLNYLTESLANKKKKLHLNTDNFLDKVKKFLKLPTIDEKNYKRRLSYLSYKTIAELISDAQRLSLKEDDLYSFFSPDELVWKKSLKILRKQLYYKIFWDTYFQPTPGIAPKQIIMTSCCSKVPGQQLVGILKNNLLKVHSYYCQQNDAHQGKRIFINWDEKALLAKPKLFEVKIVLFGYVTPTIANQILQIVLQQKIVIEKFDLQKTPSQQRFKGELIIKVSNINQLEKMSEKLKVNGLIQELKVI